MIILDILSTNQGAYRLVRNRVKKINEIKEITNYIVCPEGEYTQQMLELGIPIINFEVERDLTLKSVMVEVRNLIQIMRRVQPHVIHSHNSKTGAIARIAGSIYNKFYKRKVLIIHQVHGYHFTSFTGVKYRFFSWVEKTLANITDYILFQNKYEYNLSIKMKMDKKAKLNYIGNGIYFDEFKDYISDHKILNQDQKLIICIARVEKVKNHEMIMEVLRILNERKFLQNYKCIFIGEQDKEYVEELKKISVKYCLDPYIKFSGKLDRDETLNYLKKADLSILASIKEGKPRALMEAMYMGVPCVGTNVVGTNEVIQNHHTGYLVSLNDYQSMAEKIECILKNSELWMAFSSESVEYAKKKFDEMKVIEKLISIYTKGYS